MSPAVNGGYAASTSASARIERHLRALLADGWGRDEPLPTEEALAAEFGVSRMTARQAFQRLAASGAIVRYRSRGSFAAPSIVEDLTAWRHFEFTKRWADQGHVVELRTLTCELRVAPAAVAAEFGLRKRTRVTYLERLRLVDGTPCTLDRFYSPTSVLPVPGAEELEQLSLVGLMARHSAVADYADHHITARPANDDEAQPLGVRPGDAVVVFETRDLAADDELLAIGVSVYPAGRVTYRIRTHFHHEGT